jgi:hypothetical protein
MEIVPAKGRRKRKVADADCQLALAFANCAVENIGKHDALRQ